MSDHALVAAIQTSDEIQAILGRLVGHEIAGLQVLGINSLKSISPMPGALTGETIAGSSVVDRIITIRTSGHSIRIDLQRTGRLVWLDSAETYSLSSGTSRPTVRLLLNDRAGLDLTEPAKTKRITVTIVAAPE